MLKITGLDKVQKQLREIEKHAQELHGAHDVPFEELFTPGFLRRYSEFDSLEAMFEASGFQVETSEDFEAIPDDAWDRFISKTTRFSDWKAMLQKAGAEYVQRRLGF